MPSTSKKQHRFMEAVAHDPKFAAKAKVPVSVGKEFAAADKATGAFQASKRAPRKAKRK